MDGPDGMGWDDDGIAFFFVRQREISELFVAHARAHTYMW